MIETLAFMFLLLTPLPAIILLGLAVVWISERIDERLYNEND